MSSAVCPLPDAPFGSDEGRVAHRLVLSFSFLRAANNVAPGFYVPPSEQSILEERVRQHPELRKQLLGLPDSSRASGSGSGSGLGAGAAGGRASNSLSRASLLQPGESVPGELTRDEDEIDDGAEGSRTRSDMDLVDADDASYTRRTARSAGGDDSEAGQGRRHQQPRGTNNNFSFDANANANALTPTSKQQLLLQGDASRRSYAGIDDRTVDMDLTNVYGAEGGADATLMSRLADVTRESLFGPDASAGLGGGRSSVGGTSLTGRRLDEGELSEELLRSKRLSRGLAAADEDDDLFGDAGVGANRR